jgi:hypothetical protein
VAFGGKLFKGRFQAGGEALDLVALAEAQLAGARLAASPRQQETLHAECRTRNLVREQDRQGSGKDGKDSGLHDGRVKDVSEEHALNVSQRENCQAVAGLEVAIKRDIEKRGPGPE